jgi:hypothetical protein
MSVVFDSHSESKQGNSPSTISPPDPLFPLAPKNFTPLTCKNLDIRIVVVLFIILEFDSYQRIGK